MSWPLGGPQAHALFTEIDGMADANGSDSDLTKSTLDSVPESALGEGETE